MTYLEDIMNLTRSLLPTGRAWRIPQGSPFDKLLQGLAMSEVRADNAALAILDRILADNDNFTAADASEWERRLGLQIQPYYISLAIRKTIILRKYAFPGKQIYRQNWRFMQAQLRLAGFDVYVHENLNGLIDVSWVNDFQHGLDTEHGDTSEMGSSSIDMIANSAQKGEAFTLNDSKGVFFICGATYPNPGIVSPNLIYVFRQLVLMLKPANTVSVCIINYVHTGNFIWMDSTKGQITTMAGGHLQLMSYV